MQSARGTTLLIDDTPGHFTVTGAADIESALSARGDDAYISTDGEYLAGDRAPRIRMHVGGLLRPHVRADTLRVNARVRMAAGAFSTPPEIALVDMATHDYKTIERTRDMVRVDRLTDSGWADISIDLDSELLRGRHVGGIRNMADLALDFQAPTATGGTNELAISSFGIEASALYPSQGKAATYRLRNVGPNYEVDNMFGWVQGNQTGSLITHTVSTQGKPMLGRVWTGNKDTFDHVMVDTLRRAGWDVAPGNDVIIEFVDSGSAELNHVMYQWGLQNNSVSPYWVAYWRQNGPYGTQSAFRKMENVFVRSENTSNSGRAELRELWDSPCNMDGNLIDMGHIGFESVRFYKPSGPVTGINGPLNHWSFDHLLGLYDCHFSGAQFTGQGAWVGEAKWYVRTGGYAHDVVDCKFGGEPWEHCVYHEPVKSDSQYLRNRNYATLSFHPSYPYPGFTSATPFIPRTMFQFVQRSRDVSATWQGNPPGAGNMLIEENYADNAGSEDATVMSCYGFLGDEVVYRRNHTIALAGGGHYLIASDSADGLGQGSPPTPKGTHWGELGQFEGASERWDPYTTKASPVPDTQPASGSCYSTTHVVIEDASWSGGGETPIRTGGCKLVTIDGVGTAGWSTGKRPFVWDFQHGKVNNTFKWIAGGAGGHRSLGYEFITPTGVSVTEHYGVQLMGFGAGDNPDKPTVGEVPWQVANKAFLSVAQINRLVPGNSDWPPKTSGGKFWEQRADWSEPAGNNYTAQVFYAEPSTEFIGGVYYHYATFNATPGWTVTTGANQKSLSFFVTKPTNIYYYVNVGNLNASNFGIAAYNGSWDTVIRSGVTESGGSQVTVLLESGANPTHPASEPTRAVGVEADEDIGTNGGFIKSSGAWTDLGIIVGDSVWTQGFATEANNGVWTVKALSGANMETEETGTVDEAAAQGHTLQLLRGYTLQQGKTRTYSTPKEAGWGYISGFIYPNLSPPERYTGSGLPYGVGNISPPNNTITGIELGFEFSDAVFITGSTPGTPVVFKPDPGEALGPELGFEFSSEVSILYDRTFRPPPIEIGFEFAEPNIVKPVEYELDDADAVELGFEFTAPGMSIGNDILPDVPAVELGFEFAIFDTDIALRFKKNDVDLIPPNDVDLGFEFADGVSILYDRTLRPAPVEMGFEFAEPDLGFDVPFRLANVDAVELSFEFADPFLGSSKLQPDVPAVEIGFEFATDNTELQLYIDPSPVVYQPDPVELSFEFAAPDLNGADNPEIADSFAEVAETIRTAVEAANVVPQLAIIYDNSPPPPTTEYWLRVSIRHGFSEFVEMATRNAYRYGVVTVQSFGPIGSGDTLVRSFAELMGETLTGTIKGVTFTPPEYRWIGINRGLYQANAEIPFRYEATTNG